MHLLPWFAMPVGTDVTMWQLQLSYSSGAFTLTIYNNAPTAIALPCPSLFV